MLVENCKSHWYCKSIYNLQFAICNLQSPHNTRGLLLSVVFLALLAGVPSFAEEKVVIPFDFVSKFDDGVYGEKVGDMLWQRLNKQGKFVIPETMLDVRDTCKTNGRKPSPERSLDEMKKIVREDFGAHVGIWGSVERVPGHEWEVYDVVLKCVDFSGPKPKVIYDRKARTKSVSEIPHLYVKEMLDALYGRKPGGPPPVDESIEENWKKNPNLVIGDFQQGSGKIPKGWESTGAQPREPLGNKVKWIAEAGNPKNRVVRFTFDKATGDSYGVMYYSKPFPIEELAMYRFQCRWRTNGPAVKVFIKCYDRMGTKYQRESERTAERSPGDDEQPSQDREVYRSQQNLKGPKNEWNTQSQEFTPKHTQFTPRWGRVMLYAYLGAGVVEFDDIVLKQVKPPPKDLPDKIKRHSLETGVTIKQMEEDERRSREK